MFAATGAGKSIILAGICERRLQTHPNSKILILSHTRHILKQDIKALRNFFDRSELGLYSSGLNSKTVKKITVAGIQSAYSKFELFTEVDYVIVDESHLVDQINESTRYTSFLNQLNSQAIILGLTATPFRTNIGHLTDGHIFDKVVAEIRTAYLIKHGWLASLTTKETDVKMDTSSVKVIAGEYSLKSLSDTFDRINLTIAICEELLRYKDVRKHWLLFAIDINHAEHIAQYLNDHGVTAAAVHSKVGDQDNDIFVKLFKKGRIQVLVNVATLTTGFDVPFVDLVGLLRPTRSPILHVQMPGRGMRPIYAEDFPLDTVVQRLAAIAASDKKNCLLLDFAGNLDRLGPIDDVDFTFKPQIAGAPSTYLQKLIKTCPICKEKVAISSKVCPDCAHEFQSKEELETISSSAAIFADQQEILNSYDIQKVYYYKSTDMTPNRLRVVYRCSKMRRFIEYVPFGNEDYKEQTKKWWSYRTDLPMPQTVDVALMMQDVLAKPKRLTVNESGKNPKIVNFDFEYEEY